MKQRGKSMNAIIISMFLWSIILVNMPLVVGEIPTTLDETNTGLLVVTVYDDETMQQINASIYLDGIYMGNTTQVESLAILTYTGEHTVKAEADGYKSKSVNVIVTSDDTPLSIKLKPEKEIKSQPLIQLPKYWYIYLPILIIVPLIGYGIYHYRKTKQLM